MITIIRLLLTVYLLVMIWQNAHWSVGLFLTLWAVNNEIGKILSYSLSQSIKKQLKELEKLHEAKKEAGNNT